MAALESRPSLIQVSDSLSDQPLSSSSQSSPSSVSTSPASPSLKGHQNHHHAHKNSDHIRILNRLRHHQRGHRTADKAKNNEIKSFHVVDRAVSSLVTQVIETVSLVQIIDPSGIPLTTQTLFAAPATVVVDPATGNTVEISSSNDLTAAAVPGSDPATTRNGPLSSEASVTSTASMDSSLAGLGPSTQSSSGSSLTSSSPSTSSSTSSSFSSSKSSATTTTAAASTTTRTTATKKTTRYPSMSVAHNSTVSTSQSHKTADSTPRASRSFRPLAHTQSHSKHSSSHHSTHALSHTTHWWGKPYSTSQPTPASPTSGADGVTSNGSGSGSPSSTAASSSADSSGPGLSTQQKSIVGGVIGGCAGAAFILLLVMMALRYKKRRDRALLRQGDGADHARGINSEGGTGGGGGDGGDGSRPSMTERAAPVGVTAALAALAKKRKSQAKPEDTGERSFYRVSGRKLPSVLVAGGDGYTDPRGSTMSGETDYYRGSQAFEPAAGTTRLALGSPMRPVSGVPIMRTGPGRTAREEHNPFADPPPPPAGHRGTSIAESENSVSASRFQERI